MDFFQIECFLEVAKFENFTLAAKYMYVSQSTVSKKIQKLEEELGTALFERARDGAQLTTAGRQFHLFAEKVTADLDLLHDNLRALDGGAIGHLSIGTIPAVSFGDISRYISAFVQQNLAIRTDLVESDQVSICRKVLEKQLDFAFVRDYRMPEEFVKYALAEDEFVFYCRHDHPLANQRGVKLSQVNGLRMVLLDDSSAINGIARSFFTKMNVKPDIVMTNSRHEVLLDLIQMEDLCTCLPKELRLPLLDGISYFTLDQEFRCGNVLVRNKGVPLRNESKRFFEHMGRYIQG